MEEKLELLEKLHKCGVGYCTKEECENDFITWDEILSLDLWVFRELEAVFCEA